LHLSQRHKVNPAAFETKVRGVDSLLQMSATGMKRTTRVVPRPLILHITGDYPDATRAPTTFAIKHLIDNLTACDHVIISLTRTPDPRRMKVQELPAPASQRLFAVHHFGLPLGVGLFAAFYRVTSQIEHILDSHGLKPDYVHSHRMAFDGLAGWLISRRRRIPHIVAVRGNADRKIVRFKPTYRPLISRILRQAHRVYYVSAWMRPELERLCPALSTTDQARHLPNIVTNTRSKITPAPPLRKFVVAANLDNYKKKRFQETGIQQKGIDRLMRGFAMVASRIPDVSLDIIGCGRAENAEPLERLVEELGLAGRVQLRPALPNKDYLAELPRALAFTLPSRNETFGMVYTEALFAGVPILYSRGTGIDGHLDGLDIGVAVDPNDIYDIACALLTLAEQNGRFRAAISASAGELFRRFDKHDQVAMYMADLAAGLTAPAASGVLPASSG
jgi:glycosyltransferase involved in cell wall biosynthesis